MQVIFQITGQRRDVKTLSPKVLIKNGNLNKAIGRTHCWVILPEKYYFLLPKSHTNKTRTVCADIEVVEYYQGKKTIKINKIFRAKHKARK